MIPVNPEFKDAVILHETTWRASGEELENDGFALIGLLLWQVKGQMALQVCEQGGAETNSLYKQVLQPDKNYLTDHPQRLLTESYLIQ